MIANNFSLSSYCGRVGYQGGLRADLPTVSALMFHQLCAIPFENLDVLANKGISLEPEDLVEKLLMRQRGGYCYELNGLFAIVLQALGVPFRFVAARPLFLPAKRPKTHMALVVHLEGHDWLCDLGFGSYGMRAPLRLDVLDSEIRQGDEAFMLSSPAAHGFVFSAWVDGAWQPQYGFDLCRQEWIDFTPANYLNATHPDSLFRQKPVLVRFTPDGRNILFGDTLKVIRNGQTARHTVTATDYPDVLRNAFGLAP